jgi:magnesium-transporting ATPase (P-type)
MANQGEGLKLIAFAFKKFPARNFYPLISNSCKEKLASELIGKGLTFVSMMGLSDKIRNTVCSTVSTLFKADTLTRIVSGDHRCTVTQLIQKLYPQHHDQFKILSGEDVFNTLTTKWLKRTIN